MRYELYYWPTIQGRGEFVRLALEEARADYLDVAREKGRGLGEAALVKLWRNASLPQPPFAPPFLRAGKRIIAQTAHILQYLGPRLDLVPKSEPLRMWAHQLQLTVADFVVEIHDTHHPLGSHLYYEDQKPDALRRAAQFTAHRAPQFLAYFEAVLRPRGGAYLLGRRLSYVDLSMFQLVAGLRYAFPRMMQRMAPKLRSLSALHDRVAERPNIAAYLASPRRIAFNQEGIFRHYPELDA